MNLFFVEENKKMSEQRANLKNLSVERCPECVASLFMRDQESGEVVCTNCGFIVETKLADRGPEWRAFTPKQKKNARASVSQE